MESLAINQMQEIEGGSVVGKACAVYGTYAVGAFLLGGPTSLAAGAFCAGYAIGTQW